MATSSLTLYTDASTSLVYNLISVEGKQTKYDAASSTPTFPVGFELDRDVKPVGNLTNDRFRVNFHRSSAKSAQAKIGTSGAELKISVPKDPTSAATLVADTVANLCALVSYLTGAAPSATAVANCTKLAQGQWL